MDRKSGLIGTEQLNNKCRTLKSQRVNYYKLHSIERRHIVWDTGSSLCPGVRTRAPADPSMAKFTLMAKYFYLDDLGSLAWTGYSLLIVGYWHLGILNLQNAHNGVSSQLATKTQRSLFINH